MSGKAIAMKSLKEKWLSIVQSAEEKGEKGIGGSSTVTHPCQDYQYLNEHTIKNAYPLPLISTLINKLKGAMYFLKTDI